MKIPICVLACLVTTSLSLSGTSFGLPTVPRNVRLDKNHSLTLARQGKATCEIITLPKAPPVVIFAAKELQRLLSQSIGDNVPLRQHPTDTSTSILVGHGADVKTLPRDGFIIRASGKSIILAGQDDDRFSPDGVSAWGDYYERATLFAVYDFLERFIGATFVFPGTAGTVIPRHPNLAIPTMDILERPDNTARSISWYSGTWYEEDKGHFQKKLNNARLRMQTAYIPNCHGLGRMAYVERFGKTHPEFFALKTNGTRSCSLAENFGGQLCFSSGIREEIYKDAKAWLTGQSARSRNMWHHKYKAFAWDKNAVQPGYVNLMPQDGMIPCQCQQCKAVNSRKHGASNQVWELTCDIAKRLKADGIGGFVTQMAYGNHRYLPDVDLPDNVLVMVATQGPWKSAPEAGWEKQLETMNRWVQKMQGRRTWLWTYVNKYSGTNIPNIPCSTPLAVGEFYRQAQPHIFGSFMESEADYAVFQVFNWFVFAKKMWDATTDTKQLLRTTYEKLYGKGAQNMERFFTRIENIWLKNIAGRVVMTDIGPTACPPTDHELWNRIYGQRELEQLRKYLDDATSQTKGDTQTQQRIQFIRKHYYDRVTKARQTFFLLQQSAQKEKHCVKHIHDGKKTEPWNIVIDGSPDEPPWNEATPLFLAGLKHARTDVQTAVRLLRDDKFLYVAYVNQEPNMKDAYCLKLPPDDPNRWTLDSVEIFISPDSQRQGYYQWMISRDGTVTDLIRKNPPPTGTCDYTWDSNAVVKTACQKNSWTLEMAIPLNQINLSDTSQIVANFTRSRTLKSDSKATRYHSWSPFVKNYGDVENFRLITFTPQTTTNIIKNGSFAHPRQGRFFGNWATYDRNVLPQNDWIALDRHYFLSDGQSLRIDNPGTQNILVTQMLPTIRKGRTYRLTMAIRTQERKPGTGGIFIHFNDGANVSFPNPSIRGTTPWTFYTRTFTARKTSAEAETPCYIRLYSYHFNGTAWFDDVRFEEVD